MTIKERPTGLARPPHADLFEREQIDPGGPAAPAEPGVDPDVSGSVVPAKDDAMLRATGRNGKRVMRHGADDAQGNNRLAK